MVPFGITNLRQEHRDLMLPWLCQTVEVPLAHLTLLLQRLSPLAVVLAISVMASTCEGWRQLRDGTGRKTERWLGFR